MLRQLFKDNRGLLIASNIRVDAAAKQIADFDHYFDLSDSRQQFDESPFKDTKTIFCRNTYDFAKVPTTEEFVEHMKTKGLVEKEAIDTPEYVNDLSEVYKLVCGLAQLVKAERIGRVLVAKLKANGHILPHKDYGAYHDYYDRFHVCLQGECRLRCDDKFMHLRKGEIWWFDNVKEHEVWNNEDSDRINLIIDLKLRGDRLV